MKKTIKWFGLVLMLLCLTTLFACVKGDDILNSYIFEKEDTVVSTDFVLPGEIGGQTAKWTSDNAAITLTEVPDGYRAEIGFVEDDTEVTLTVKVKNATRDYIVRVAGLDVYTFIDNYQFTYDKLVVTETFNLDTQFTYKDHTCDISWSVDTEYLDYIEVVGERCVVTCSSLDPEVKIKATFTYKGQSATKTYRMTVSMPQTSEEAMVYWYDNTGLATTLSGYVVHKGVWSVYNNVNEVILYIIDDSLTFGVYLYQEKINCTEDEYAALELGTHITCVGCESADYHGLHETSNHAGTITIDYDVPKIDVTPYALDDDLLGGVVALKYNQSRLVSLTDWQVVSITPQSEWYAQSTSPEMKISKGGVEIVVCVSKYHYGMTQTENPANQAVIDKIQTLKVGDWVSVEGLLSWYDIAELVVFDPDQITLGAEDTRTVFPGTQVGAAQASVHEAIKAAEADEIIITDLDFTLPTTFGDGGTITYQLMSPSSSFAIDGGNFTIRPSKLEKTHVRVEYTIGDYKTFEYFYLTGNKLNEAELVAKTALGVTIVKDTFDKPGEISVPTSAYGGKVKIDWATDSELVKYEDGKLLVTLGKEETSVTATATVSSGSAVETVSFVLHLAAGKTMELVNVGDYKFTLYQANLSKQLYATGEIDSTEYLSTTDNPALGAIFTIYANVSNPGTYVIMYGDKYLEIYENANNKIRSRYVDAPTDVWTWDDELKVFTFNNSGSSVANNNGRFYIGTYNTFNTYSVSSTYYIEGDKMSTIGVSQFPGLYVPANKLGSYTFSLVQGNLEGAELFSDGNIDDSCYLSTTYNKEAAGLYEIYSAGDGFVIVHDGKFLEIFENVTPDKTNVRSRFVNIPTGAWKFNEETGTYTFDLVNCSVEKNNGTYYLGTYNKYSTISPSLISYITGDNSGALDTTSFPGRYTKVQGEDLDDATMVSRTKASINIEQSLIDAPTTVDVPTFAFDGKVTVSWACSSEQVVIDSGKIVFSLGKEETDVTVTATITAGEVSDTLTFIIHINKGNSYDIFEVGKYTMRVDQNNLEKVLYATGELLETEYLSTTESIEDAGLFTIYGVKGKPGEYCIAYNGLFLEVYENAATKMRSHYVEIPTNTWKWDDELGVLTFVITGATAAKNNDTYYLGTYNTFNTFSPSATSYISGDKMSTIGVSQFPAVYDLGENFGTYTMTADQVKAGKYLYVTGEFNEKLFMLTSVNESDAALFTISKVEGGVVISLNGKFLELYEWDNNGSLSVRPRFVSLPTGVWTLQEDLGVYTFHLEGCNKASNNGDFYIGTYNNYETLSPSSITYISGDKASTIGDTQFPAFYNIKVSGEKVKLACDQVNLGKTLYATGEISDGYLATAEEAGAGELEVVYLNANKTAYFLIANGKFVEVFENSSTKIRIQLADKPSDMWVYDSESGQFAFAHEGSTKANNNGKFYLGTYSNYNTISCSSTFYITGDKAGDVGVSQFVCYLVK